MMRLSQAAQVVKGRLHGEDAGFEAVSKDTRSIRQGDLYVALRGERFDGHAFVARAQQAGAAGALVQQPQDVALAQVSVDDTRVALGELAAHWRMRFDGVLIGLTGSNGKTTVKEMCRHILQQHVQAADGSEAVLATEGNLNNDIGMPMTLLWLRSHHRFAVIEMGANHMGEIDYLSRIARPDIALLNNAGPAHLEGFGSLENVATAKAEIFAGLREAGTAVINLDDRFAPQWLQQCRDSKRMTFSASNAQADVFTRKLGGRLHVCTQTDTRPLSLAVPGRHNVMNALAATAACLAAGVELAVIAAALGSFRNIAGRLREHRLGNGAIVLDDSYNANPASVQAGIDVLAAKGGDSVLVLGDMGELGEDAEALHAAIGQYARKAGVQRLLATGELSRAAVEAFGEGASWFADKPQLAAALHGSLRDGCVVLVKGSRVMHMEQLVETLIANHATPEVN